MSDLSDLMRPEGVDPDLWQMCLRKHAYTSHEAAHKAKKRREKSTGKQWRLYACPHCPDWHLTTKPKTEEGQAHD